MDLGIRGKVAIVTGASVGVGRAIARELAENGVDIILVARGVERLEAAAAEIASRYAVRTLAIPVDVAEVEAPSRVVERAAREFGRIDILVNDAGRAHAGGLMQTTEASSRTSNRRRCHRSFISSLAEG